MKIEKGTKVFITGAASGIGRATAVACGRKGAMLFLCDVNADGLDVTSSMADDAGGDVAMSRVVDVSKLDQVKAFADTIHPAYGPMDVVMNVAGVALYALIEDMSHQDWERVININLWGPIHVIECFLPEMIKAKRGHLLNVSSASGLSGAPLHAAYAAAKFGLVGISEVLHYDLMQHNIKVSVVCPGAVDTPLKDTVVILGADPDSHEVKRMKKLFTRHAITPERAGEILVDAVEKEKFLAITSFDIKAMYFFKRFIPPLYNYIMLRIGKLLYSIKK